MDLLPPYPPPYALLKHVPTPLFDSFFVVKWLLNDPYTLNTLNSILNAIPTTIPTMIPTMIPTAILSAIPTAILAAIAA